MTPLLEVRNLRVRFPSMPPLKALLGRVRDPFIDAVCGVSFEIRPGETFVLVGESGSGKTTLARAILGLMPSQEGSARFQGIELRGLEERAWKPLRREMAMMFQDPVGSLSPRKTVRALIAEPFRIHGIRDRDLDAECTRLLHSRPAAGLRRPLSASAFRRAGASCRRGAGARAVAETDSG